MTYIPPRDLRAVSIFDPHLLEDPPVYDKWSDPRQWGLGAVVSLVLAAALASPVLVLALAWGAVSACRATKTPPPPAWWD